ncbi:MAG: hypothetical protein J2P41_04215 [Blastocatellia bacterium]|nr:hypothetical protein [Blastocatellia bacterium]
MNFDLEKELQRALRREDAPRDFTDRVMTRLAAAAENELRKQNGNRWWRRLAEFFRPPEMKWSSAGVAALLLILAVVGVQRHRSERRAEIAEGERAKEQVMLAMKIASAKLNIAQKKVRSPESGVRSP